jgi:hypothetical protein
MHRNWSSLAAAAALLLLAVCHSTLVSAQGAINSGETVTGTISPIGDSDAWTFAAITGDTLVLRVGEITQTGSFTPRIRLFNPSSGLVATQSGAVAAEIVASAAATGTYTVIVDDLTGTTATGTYRLTLARTGVAATALAGDEGGALINGALHTGTIDVGDLDVWTFTAATGDAIVVRMGETVASSALTPYLRLYSPTGTLLDTSFSAAGAEVAATATAAGTYVVVAGDTSSNFAGSGGYRMTLAKTGADVVVSAGDEGGSLTNGAMHTGTLDVGELDVWTFTAAAGDAIVVRMGETAASTLTPWLRLFNPNGTLVSSSFSATGAEVTATAAVPGTWLVVAGDTSPNFAGSGAYRLTLAKTGAAVTVSAGDEGGPLTNGAMHTGTLDIGDLDVWTFAAIAGEAIVVRMGETTPGSSLTPWLRLYSPTGTLLDTSFSAAGAEVTATASTTGTYLVVAADTSASFAGSGGYRLTLAKTGTAVTVSAGDEGGPLTNGATHTGTLDVGDLDVWTFSAVAGDAIVVRMGEPVAGPLTPWLRLYGPGGTLLDSSFSAAGAEVVATAGTTGTYLVVAGDTSPNFAGTGNYRLTLAKTGAAVTVSPGDEGGPMSNGAMHTGTLEIGDLDVWTFAAVAGEAIVVRMGETTSGSLTPWLRLYGPTGVALGSSQSAAGAEVAVTAGATGTYLVVAADTSSNFAGSGGYRLTLAKTGTPVTVSPGDQGGALTNGAHPGVIDVGDLDVWTIQAVSGDHLSITMTEDVAGGSLTPQLRLYSPTGVLLGSNSGTGLATLNVTTAATGRFLLVAGDLSSAFAGSGAYTLNGSGATGFPTPMLDIDLSVTATRYDALTDGLVVLRYLLGLTGQPMIEGALGGTASRTDPAAIRDYLDNIRPALDIDGNGTSDPYTDGVLIIRYLFGLRGDSLINAAFDPQGSRNTAFAIENYLLSLTP